MPSVLIGNPLASGAQQIVSGNPWSGAGPSFPLGGIQLLLSPDASGNVYIGLSGGINVTSGGMFLSGSLGYMDALPLQPGGAYFIPKTAFRTSGEYNVYARHDAACSGQARLYWEIY